ncbi:MAG: hypothetical protein WCK10_01795 [Candidatus Staskawiczbacteria bacterium]
MNKDDEQVLAIKSEIIFKEGRWQGLKENNLDYYIDLIKENAEFKRRGDIENDDSFQQVIPYILFSFQNKYFIYNYLDSVAEKRLINNYQIGIGGHINKEDIGENKNILEAGMMREWNEEVDFKGNILEKRFIGIMNDDSRPVESVHIALVYHFIGDSPDISIKETDKMVGQLMELSAIGEYIKDNPGVWIQIIYKEYLSKLL